MSEEIVLETGNELPLAPSCHSIPTIEADQALAKELEDIPSKMMFKIGEVANLLKVKPYVLRYWETEFKVLNPQKSKHNQRAYSRKDVELLFIIKKLLYKDRFSIEGARSILGKMRKETKKALTIRGAMEQIEELKNKTHDLIMDIRRLHASLN